MTIKEIYEKFEKIGCLTFATIGDDGYPETRIAHLFAYDEEGLYLRTMEVKPFYKQLTENGKLSICGMSASTQVTHDEKGLPLFQPGFTLRATGDVKEISFDELLKKESKSAGFAMGIADMRKYTNERALILYRFKGELYDYDFELVTRDHKLSREQFSFGDFPITFKGQRIGDNCISCGLCKKKCDEIKFKAIYRQEDGKYFIDNSRCDACGSCTMVCPQKCIEACR